jgi:capsular polysaccharide biosynthesis protein
MGNPLDGWIEGPGLPQSVWRYKWLVSCLVLLGIFIALLWASTQPTRYEGVVRIFVAAEQGTAGDPERIVISQAQFIESSTVSDRVIALTGKRLTPKELDKRLSVEPSANGDFITIRARDTTPSSAAELADAVDLAYRQILSEQRKASANRTIAELDDAQARLTRELAQIKEERRTGDNPALQAEEQAKKRQMEATANKIEEVSADMAGPPSALQDKAAVPDEPVQPKPLLAAAIGAFVGLVIGIALAWWLAARRIRPSGDTTESQVHIADDHEEPPAVLHDLVEQPDADGPPAVASDLGAAAAEIHNSPEQVRQLADVDDGATASVGQAVNSLDKDPDLLYSLAEWLESQHQNFPQITAERLRDRLLFDRVAVLLKTDDGLDLAGCVGWQPIGVGQVGRYDQSILTKLGGNGARLIGSADRRRLLKAGLLGAEAQTIIVAPLKHENVAFGVLLVGHEKPGSGAPLRANGSVDGIGSFARSVAPDLHAWLLLHKLREQLASHREAQEQTTSLAESEAPSAESELRPAESEAPSAESELRPAESEAPSAESELRPAEPEAPPPWPVYPAEPETPSAESEPPSAESKPPTLPPRTQRASSVNRRTKTR